MRKVPGNFKIGQRKSLGSFKMVSLIKHTQDHRNIFRGIFKARNRKDGFSQKINEWYY